jgi:hypothetical protein
MNQFVNTLSDQEKLIFQQKSEETNRVLAIYGECVFDKENRHLLPCYSHPKEIKCNCIFNKKMTEIALNFTTDPLTIFF